MQFVLWVAKKIDLQAWRAYLIFKYMMQKCFDQKNIYIFMSNIFLTILKMNKQQLVYTYKEKNTTQR